MIIRQKYGNLWRFRPWQGRENYRVHADSRVMPMIITLANEVNLTFTLPEFNASDVVEVSGLMLGTGSFHETLQEHLPRDVLQYGYQYSKDYFEQVPCKFQSRGVQYD